MAVKKRSKTIYGIHVPPWRDKVIGKALTLVFIVTGRIPSKKNELVAVVDRNEALKKAKSKEVFSSKEVQALLFETFGRVVNSKKYQEWEESTVTIFKDQLSKNIITAQNKGLIFPVARASVNIRFYWKGKYKRDNSNKAEGIMDALVKAHIIQDDSYLVANPTKQEADDFTDEILDSMAVIYVNIPI